MSISQSQRSADFGVPNLFTPAGNIPHSGPRSRDCHTRNERCVASHEGTGFASLGLDKTIVATLYRSGICTPTPIQVRSIPVCVSGGDLIGIAQTGTGKTLAFLLPLINRFLVTNDRALVLVPTRELALQVEECLRSVITGMKARISSITIIGGSPMRRQCEALARNPRFVIATPGRLIDHIERGSFKLSQYNNLVLDEADRMLDMGFLPAIRRIIAKLPKDRQTLLFSATFDEKMVSLAQEYLRDAVRIEVSPPGSVVAKIKQQLCYLEQGEKPEALKRLLSLSSGPTLVFSRTKHGASKLKKVLDRSGFDTAEIHADRTLGQRRNALEGFKRGTYRVLVATDIAARGIDVHGIDLVVNYDLPDVLENYVHRIGRTARAGRGGVAVSFATLDQHSDVLQIERLMKTRFELSSDSAPAPEVRRAKTSGPKSRRRWTSGRPKR
jgi:ATP-dependent RNA helicase RhlE